MEVLFTSVGIVGQSRLLWSEIPQEVEAQPHVAHDGIARWKPIGADQALQVYPVLGAIR